MVNPLYGGIRITVSTVLEYLAAGESVEKILDAYPILEPEDIKACLAYAKMLSDKSILTYDIKAS